MSCYARDVEARTGNEVRTTNRPTDQTSNAMPKTKWEKSDAKKAKRTAIELKRMQK